MHYNIDIADGRKFFWQWDTGCKLRLIGADAGLQAHFYRDGMTEPLTVVAYALGEDIVCDIPDEILQIAQTFAVYTYIPTADGGKTHISRAFPVKGRPKPVDYIYTPSDILTVEKLVGEAIEEILEKGVKTSTPDYNENNPESKSYIANRPFYDTREVDENGEETGELKTLEDKYLDLENRAKIKEVESIAKGANQARSFGDYATMIEALNALPNDLYSVGQNIMIVTLNVPDLWVSAIADDSVPYTYVDDASFANEIATNGSVQVGYYVLSALETQKVDLTNYVKNTDVANIDKYGVFRMSYASGTGLQMTNGYLKVSAPNTDAISQRNGSYPLIIGSLDTYMRYGITGRKTIKGVETLGNQIALTDKEKDSALKWLGVVSEGDFEYTCNAYNHSAAIEGSIHDHFGFASYNIFSLNELQESEIEVYCDGEYGGGIVTLSLENARVIELDGGYALSVSVSSIYSDCPDARVIVVTDVNSFNKQCNCDLESTGTYLSMSQRDGLNYTLSTTVKSLRATALQINNEYLDLENNEYLNGKFGDIESALDGVISLQNSLIGGEA